MLLILLHTYGRGPTFVAHPMVCCEDIRRLSVREVLLHNFHCALDPTIHKVDVVEIDV